MAQEKGDEAGTSGLGQAATGAGPSAAAGSAVTAAALAAVPPAVAAASGAAAAEASSSRRTERAESDADLVNPQHLQALMDMGFARDQCVEALLFTTSLEQATDYLLSAPPSILRAPHPAVAGSAAPGSAAMDTDGNDEDAVMRAIALSLTADAERSEDGDEKEPKEYTLQDEPLSKDILDNFVQQALTGCLSLLDALPETVYRVCNLVVAMVQRNGEAYRDTMLSSLAKEIENCIGALQVGGLDLIARRRRV